MQLSYSSMCASTSLAIALEPICSGLYLCCVTTSRQAILRKPSVQIVMLELYPHLLAQSGYELGAANVLNELKDSGFSKVQHVGYS